MESQLVKLEVSCVPGNIYMFFGMFISIKSTFYIQLLDATWPILSIPHELVNSTHVVCLKATTVLFERLAIHHQISAGGCFDRNW